MNVFYRGKHRAPRTSPPVTRTRPPETVYIEAWVRHAMDGRSEDDCYTLAMIDADDALLAEQVAS